MSTVTNREPVIVAFAIGAIPLLAAFALQVLDATGTLDSASWLRTLLAGVGPVVTALGALWARMRVTPTSAG